MQACGVSLRRLLRPVALISVGAWAATSYVLIAWSPTPTRASARSCSTSPPTRRRRGQAARRSSTTSPISSSTCASAEPGRRLERRLPRRPARRRGAGGLPGPARPAWSSTAQRQRIDLELIDATTHSVNNEGKYDVKRFQRGAFAVDPAAMFSRVVSKSPRQMSIAELREQMATRRQQIDPASMGPIQHTTRRWRSTSGSPFPSPVWSSD